MNPMPSASPYQGYSHNLAIVLTGNGTGNLLVRGMMPNQLSNSPCHILKGLLLTLNQVQNCSCSPQGLVWPEPLFSPMTLSKALRPHRPSVNLPCSYFLAAFSLVVPSLLKASIPALFPHIPHFIFLRKNDLSSSQLQVQVEFPHQCSAR